MKLSALAPVFLLSLGTLTACGGSDSTEPTPTPKDTTAPVITLNGSTPLTHSIDTSYDDEGATANDATDGNVDVTITGSVDSTIVNSYTLTYTATDTAGNKSTSTRIVNVIDDVAPEFGITGDNPVIHNAGEDYTEKNITVTDNVDETSAITVTTSGEVDVNVIASYDIIYTATDTKGNVSNFTRTVKVEDISPPKITLNGEAIITLADSAAYKELSAIVEDNVDTIVTLITTGEVLATPGTYTITYSATDSADLSASATRTVIVEEDIKPDVFGFTEKTEVFLNTVVESAAVTITGLNVAAAVNITNGEFSINGAAYTNVTTKITSGQNIKIRTSSAALVGELEQASLTIGSLTESFDITTRTAEPSGLFGGTGTVNGGTSLTAVKGIIYNEHFMLFDELAALTGESVLYEGNILTYTGTDFTATVDVYKDGVKSQTVAAMGSIVNTTFLLTLNGDTADYGRGTINVNYDNAYIIPATQARFKTEFAHAWVGQSNTMSQGYVFAFKAESDANVFTGGVKDNANNGCIYDNNAKFTPNASVNIFAMSFDTEDTGNSNCDHIGTNYKGFTTIFNVGTGGVMWFAATNGIKSTFSLLTYQ